MKLAVGDVVYLKGTPGCTMTVLLVKQVDGDPEISRVAWLDHNGHYQDVYLPSAVLEKLQA